MPAGRAVLEPKAVLALTCPPGLANPRAICSPPSKSPVVPIPAYDPAGNKFLFAAGVIDVANYEFELRVFIQSNQNRQTVLAPRVNDHLQPQVWKNRFAILKENPFKPCREDLIGMYSKVLRELRKMSKYTAVLSMQLKTGQHDLLSSGRNLPGEPARVKAFGVDRNTATGKTFVFENSSHSYCGTRPVPRIL